MAVPGTMGKFLFVDLTTGTVSEETPPDEFYLKYLGGYGIGCDYLFRRQKAGIDPLGPENVLGFITGVLTGTAGINTNRYTLVAKSPKTGTWGDANCGGKFGPAMKQAGVDGIFVTGASDKPVSILLHDGTAQILPAEAWWGLETGQTEDRAREVHGKKVQTACIGPAGERQSLLACVITDKGRAAGRSGLGAVMGSKKLKAVVVLPTGQVPVADPDGLKAAVAKYKPTMQDRGWYQALARSGTGGGTVGSIRSADAPIKNWDGVPDDFTDTRGLDEDKVLGLRKRRYGCWHCAIVCGGRTQTDQGPYAGTGHVPEYETLGAFGPMCLNPDLASITTCNEICNRFGLDTISTGCTIAFAIECFERGLITAEETGGIELRWGCIDAIVAATEQIARGEGFGKVLADGSKVAAERIGKGAEQYAMHVGGEEVPMHDPRLNPSLALVYQMDATPARHTQTNAWCVEQGFAPGGMQEDAYPIQRYEYAGKGEANRDLHAFFHVVNAVGQCQFAACNMPASALVDQINCVTGQAFTLADILTIGNRLATIRIMFNLREGVRNIDLPIPRRMLAQPSDSGGPLAGVEIDEPQQVRDYCTAMGWDPETGIPTPETLRSLGLEFTAPDVT